MLKILINGDALDLPTGIELNFVIENPLLLTDRIPSAHTLTGDLQLTRRNLRILGNHDRINRANRQREYDGLTVSFGPVVLMRGVFVLQEFDQSIKYYLRGSVFPADVKVPGNEANIDQYDFDGAGSRFTPDFDNPANIGGQYKEFIEDSLDNSKEYAVAPFRFKGREWNGNPVAPATFGNVHTTYLYFNYYNPNREEFILVYPSFNAHTICHPMIKVYHLIDKILGSNLVNNPFNTGELSRLVLTNTFHPLYFPGILTTYRGMLLDTTELDPAQFLRLQTFYASISFADAIKEIMKLFCMTLFIRGNDFEFKYNANIITDPEKEDWDAKLIGKLAHWVEDGQSYSYGYEGFEGKDAPQGITFVDDIADLALQTIADGEEKEVYVHNTKQLFNLKNRFDEDTGVEDEYEYVTEVLDPGFAAAKGTPKSGFNMLSGITPMPVNLHPYWWTNTGSPIKMGQWYVPEWDGDRLTRPEKPHIMIYQGLRDTFTEKSGGPAPLDKYPYLAAHNVDGHGNNLGDLTLYWEGDDGLLNTYHTEFKAWIESEKLKARGIFLLDALDIKNLDLAKRKNVKGIDWFVERMEFTVVANKIQPARVTLIEAPEAGSAYAGL
jgi:hypothetical protein